MTVKAEDLDTLRAASRDADAALKTANAAVDAAVIAQRDAENAARIAKQAMLDFLNSNVAIAVSLASVDPVQ